MKSLVVMLLAFGLAAPFASSSFAQDTPTDQASCEDAGMVWDEASETCSPAD
jgi:hypothetical protein